MAEHPSQHALKRTFITHIREEDKLHVKLFYCTACVTYQIPFSNRGTWEMQQTHKVNKPELIQASNFKKHFT